MTDEDKTAWDETRRLILKTRDGAYLLYLEKPPFNLSPPEIVRALIFKLFMDGHSNNNESHTGVLLRRYCMGVRKRGKTPGVLAT